MADQPGTPEPHADRVGDEPTSYPGPPPGAPRWVKVAGLVAAVIVLLAVALLLSGRFGEHGPGRHGSHGGDGTTTLAADHASFSGGRG